MNVRNADCRTHAVVTVRSQIALTDRARTNVAVNAVTKVTELSAMVSDTHIILVMLAISNRP